MLVYQKTMFDRYYCIKLFCKTWENALKNLLFYYEQWHKKPEGFVSIKNVCSRAKTFVILKSLNYVYFYERYC